MNNQKGNLLVVVIIGIVVCVLATVGVIFMTQNKGKSQTQLAPAKTAAPQATASGSAQSAATPAPTLSSATDDASLQKDLDAYGNDINQVDSESSAVLGIATSL